MTGTVVRLPARIGVRLSGERALQFLQDVSTQDVAGLRTGQGTLVAFLTDKGKLQAFARVLVLDDGVLLDAVEAARPGLEQAMRVAPLAGVDVAFVSLDAARVHDSDALRRVGFEPPQAPYAVSSSGRALCVRGGWGESGWDVLIEGEASPEVNDLMAHAEPSVSAIEEVRVAEGLPAFGIDVDADTHINETPLVEHAVSFTKGCYPGQESVARVRNLGRVKRMVRVLALEGPVEPGDPVADDGRSVGTVTSVGSAHALALVASDVEPGTRVQAGPSGATVTAAGWE